MSWNPTTPVTGAAQTGFTSPTYTLTTDVAPDNNGKQHAVTALGGTQTGVTTHSVSAPFTLTFARPKSLKPMPPVVSGQNPSIPKNVYKTIIRKGVTPAAGLATQVAICTIEYSIPAGSDTYDAANIRAMLSLAIGALQQQSAGLGDTLVSGIM